MNIKIRAQIIEKLLNNDEDNFCKNGEGFNAYRDLFLYGMKGYKRMTFTQLLAELKDRGLK